MANVTILSIFRTHAQKEYRKVSKMKGTYILIVGEPEIQKLEKSGRKVAEF